MAQRDRLGRGLGVAALAAGLALSSAGWASEAGKPANPPADHSKDAGQDTDHEVGDSAKKAGQSIKKAAEDTGDTLEKGAKKTGKALDNFGHNVAHFFKHMFD